MMRLATIGWPSTQGIGTPWCRDSLTGAVSSMPDNKVTLNADSRKVASGGSCGLDMDSRKKETSSFRGSLTVEITMDPCASPLLQHSRTRLLLVDTDNLFLDDVGGALRANEEVDVVATARSIEDAYDCAAKHTPDVIVIGWGKASRAFVHAALASQSSAGTNLLVVIVLRGGITNVPGLTSLSLLPNVALVVHERVEKFLLRHTSPDPRVLLQ